MSCAMMLSIDPMITIICNLLFVALVWLHNYVHATLQRPRNSVPTFFFSSLAFQKNFQLHCRLKFEKRKSGMQLTQIKTIKKTSSWRHEKRLHTRQLNRNNLPHLINRIRDHFWQLYTNKMVKELYQNYYRPKLK